jgi:hypothetical protein
MAFLNQELINFGRIQAKKKLTQINPKSLYSITVAKTAKTVSQQKQQQKQCQVLSFALL